VKYSDKIVTGPARPGTEGGSVVRAVVIREFGPPDVLKAAEVDEVRAGADEVVIDVEFANVTFVETQVRAGRPPHPSMLPALPAILGNGVGGTVAGIGAGRGAGTGAAAGVGTGAGSAAGAGAGAAAGRRVVASLNGTGGYAERAVSPASRLIDVPDAVTTRDAVALLADGRTALALAARAALQAGDTVLIEAAGGGVGTLLVQIARNAGARVVALAGHPRKLALARDLGADLTVDYRHGDWERQVRDAAGQVDVVFDGVGGDIGLAAFGLLGAGGRFCPFGMASGSFAPVTSELAASRQVIVPPGAGASPEGLAALARTALAEAAAGRLRPVVGQEFGLAEAAAAHAAIEARQTIGKTLLTVPR
jgi:NADPH2:quinone reductase